MVLILLGAKVNGGHKKKYDRGHLDKERARDKSERKGEKEYKKLCVCERERKRKKCVCVCVCE